MIPQDISVTSNGVSLQENNGLQGSPRSLGSEYLLPVSSVRSQKEQSMVAGPPFKDEDLASPHGRPWWMILQDISATSNGVSCQENNGLQGSPRSLGSEYLLPVSSVRSRKEQSMVAGP